MTGPEPTELIQPVIHLLEWLWLQAIETALCVHRGFHETGVAQHAQVLGDGRLRQPQPALDLSHRLLGQDQEAQDRAAVRLRDDCERRFHALSIRHRAYTCQGIYRGTPPLASFLEVHLVQGGAEPVRQLERVVVRPVVHEEEVRAVGQHMAMDGGTSTPSAVIVSARGTPTWYTPPFTLP